MRKSVFRGSFYPTSKLDVENFINDAIKKATINDDITNAVSYVVPHAGYTYSGKTAAITYKAIKENKNIENIETIIIIRNKGRIARKKEVLFFLPG